jgi:hypothetical protein
MISFVVAQIVTFVGWVIVNAGTIPQVTPSIRSPTLCCPR